MRAKRALITDGAGFIGANLARELVKQGHAVELLVEEGDSGWRIRAIVDNPGVTITRLSQSMDVRPVVEQSKPDWFFDLAHSGKKVNLLQAALPRPFEAFVQLDAPDGDGVEGLPICTVRLSSAYGPFQEPTGFMPALIINALKGSLPSLGNSTDVRDFVYVDDVVTALIIAAENAAACPGQVFDIGTGVQNTLADVVEMARSEFRVGEAAVWDSSDQPTANADAVCDISRMRDLGWRPTTSLAQGMAKLGRWLKFDPERFMYYSEFRRA